MYVKSPGVEFLETAPKFRNGEKNSPFIKPSAFSLDTELYLEFTFRRRMHGIILTDEIIVSLYFWHIARS